MYPIPWRRKKYVTRQCVETQQDFFLSLIIIKQKMCNAAIDVDPWSLYDVLDYFKTQKMCDDVVHSLSLIGLLLRNNQKYGMMTMIIALMMRFLSCIKGMKNGRLEKPQ